MYFILKFKIIELFKSICSNLSIIKEFWREYETFWEFLRTLIENLLL